MAAAIKQSVVYFILLQRFSCRSLHMRKKSTIQQDAGSKSAIRMFIRFLRISTSNLRHFSSAYEEITNFNNNYRFVIQTTANGVVQQICHTSQATKVISQKHIPVPRYGSHRVEFVYIHCTSNTNYNQLCSTATDCNAFQLLRLCLHR